MRHDGTPDGLPADDRPAEGELDAWSSDLHRELDSWSERDRLAEAGRQRERELEQLRLQQAEARRREDERLRRRAALPPELRDADEDDDLTPGPRRRLVMGTSRVLAVVALVAALALAVTAVL